ncbi:ThiF family adenylyltransferase [Patulibacter sp. NPDC049589]|uniref:HesA/MoeB/ThiF family protein n=1 Tax=Patulibacter sp. NPDC049589 TaxID=3154731 RepID=UPI00341DEAD9
MSERVLIEPEDLDGRYHRQTLITWWEQGRLRDARVLVVGAGALGNELVKNLVLMGVGTILLTDLDVVEGSNLSRCVLFRPADEGRAKATVVAAAARDLNDEVTVTPLVGDVRSVVGLSLIRDVDVVLGGLDNREARMHVNEACRKAGTPYVDGAIEGLQGIARVFLPTEGPCYECTMNARDHELVANRRSCSLLTRDEMEGGKVPTTATTASIIAGIQVQEAVKLLHGVETLSGRGFAFNGGTHDSYVVGYRAREDCMAHDHYDPQTGEDVALDATFADLLAAGRRGLGTDDVTLELEVEIATGAACATCDVVVPLARPLHELKAADVLCATCGEEMRPVTRHAVGPDDAELLVLRPDELGVAPGDAVTARHEYDRWHLWLGGALPLQDRVAAIGATA